MAYKCNKMVHKKMQWCRYIIILLLSLLSIVTPARATNDPDSFDWMGTNIKNLGSLFGCLEKPEFTSVNMGSVTLSLAKPNEWEPAQTTVQTVQKDKAIKFDWNTTGVQGNPRKYLVLYRIDPRFVKPQIFLLTFNYAKNAYETLGFPKFNSTDDPSKNFAALSFDKMKDYVDYLNFKEREKINVKRGDVVNITLIKNNDFLEKIENYAAFINQDNNESVPSALYINNYKDINFENKLIYASAQSLCDVIDPNNSNYCSGVGNDKRYLSNYAGTDNGKSTLIGRPVTGIQLATITQKVINNCVDGTNGLTNPLCFYDKGRGMRITIGNQIIKKEESSFFTSDFLDKSFLYYKSDVGGDLDFVTEWQIQGMFVKLDKPLMSNWVTGFSASSFKDYFNDNSKVDLKAKFLHFGQYIMMVEVGNSDKAITVEQQEKIEVEYLITENSTTPDPSVTGTSVKKEFLVDASITGHLWLRVKNPNPEVQGIVIVKYANYTGTTWFSDIVYNGAVKPIKDQFHKLTANFYTKFAKNSSFQRSARIALTLYVIIFGIMFLIGAVQITAQEVINRVFKIIIIVTLLGENSWEFFNGYLFNVFTEGTDYLFSNVVGLTSSKNNIFGFIDPIFDKYTNGRIWGLLFIELLQIHNGLTFVAVMTIYSLILYFRAVLEVIIGYVIAFVGLSVMIGLAPFFIIMILFEQTKSLFDNWLSTLFNYMLQPTILLIFFLLIDQILTEQLLKIVVRACWDKAFIPIKIGLDLSHMGIDWSFSFSIPFLPGIPFYTPQILDIKDMDTLLNSSSTFLVIFTTTLLFYSYCLMSYGLVEYVTIVIAQLTNVTPARQEGNPQEASNATKSIMHDMGAVAKPFKEAAIAPARFIKSKLIDQNYNSKKAPEGADDKKELPANKIFASRHDGENSRGGSGKNNN